MTILSPFFLLLGRIFQEKVYHQLSFERDYRSYFPISINRIKNKKEESVPVQEIKKGDKIVIRNGELIPVDAYLIEGKGNIDNSFATGESEPVEKEIGAKIFAGGRQMGSAITLEVIRSLEQSKITRLWSEHATHNHDAKNHVSFSDLTDQISQWFTPIILLIALFSALFYLPQGIGKSVEVISAVLIVACPCALALAAPFTFGHAMRYLGRIDCYLRESSVIEKMAAIRWLIFDKTGTLTYSQNRKVRYHGKKMLEEDEKALRAIFAQSNHPLSRIISNYLPYQDSLKVQNYEELTGKGLKANCMNNEYRLGSAQWLEVADHEQIETTVYIEKNSQIMGYFSVSNHYRKGLKTLLNKLKENYQMSMISGDHAGQLKQLQQYFPKESDLLFEQSPQDKLNYIQEAQKKGFRCMMIGDGLNDAGALLKSDVGVSIAENVNAFSPACDLILGAERFNQLDRILAFSKQCKQLVIASFIISFLYNGIGLSFAVQGLLSPVFAAILMPISSISVVGFASLSVWLIRPKN
jgi:Cu+-exporting ATPase